MAAAAAVVGAAAVAVVTVVGGGLALVDRELEQEARPTTTSAAMAVAAVGRTPVVARDRRGMLRRVRPPESLFPPLGDKVRRSNHFRLWGKP